ncbi:MAG: S8 family serine peptidase [Actinophytocola sp.]|uniref:S8 family serine peptidase n=1 Tax=Actinophytocola sp. TaxID=1872138 RepID=UPI003C77DF5B
MASSKLDGSLAARVHALGNVAAAVEGVDRERSTRVRVLVHVAGDLAAVERAGLWVEFQAPPIVVGTIAAGDLEAVAELDDVVSIGSGQLTRPTLDKSGPEIRAPQARALPPGFNGAGVVVGVVDSGIDIFHHAFRKADGKTRIVSLLDLTLRQTITTTGSPTAGTITLTWQPPRPPTPPGGVPPALPPAETTTALALPLTVAQVKTALEVFNSINPGDVVVTEGPPPAKPIMIDFAGQYGTPAFDSKKVNTFTLTTTGLTPPTAQVQITRGREFLPAEINAALQTPNTPFASRDMDGHGTHVAGIAAGDGSQSGTAQEDCTGSNTYVGIAPEADLAIVRTTFFEPDNIRGVQHIFDQGWLPAAGPKRPAVVNLSLGSLIGAHDGTRGDEIAYDGMLAGSTQRMIVISAGNDGNLYDPATPATQPKSGGGLHARKTVAAATGTPPTPGAPVTLEVMIQPNDRSEDTLDIWYSGAGRLSFTLTTPNPGGVPLPAPIVAGSGFSTPTLAGHPLEIFSLTNVAPSGKHRIRVALNPPAGGQITPGPWTITLRETAGTATDFDCWIAKDTDDPHPRIAKPADQDRTRTVGMPGTANLPITIGSYNPADEHLSALADSSARGPTADGRNKPELCAPGVGITAALTGARNTGSCCDSCATFYVDKEGTSMAAPHVTGVVALMLQANPAIDHARIKAELIASHRPPEPGAGQQPNTSGWGAGRVNAEEAVKKVKPATAMVSTDDEPLMLSASAYPANYLPARARLRRLERRVTGSPAGQLAAALISEHVDEVVRLVNTERRVIVAWHRMHGPVLLRLLLGDVDREVLVPRTLDGVPVADGLARLLDELARAGSAALRAAIVRYRTFVLTLPGARLADLDRVLRVS